MMQRELMEEGVDFERGRDRVAEILADRQESTAPNPPRKRRSDAGVKKGPKVQEKAATGVLTVEQRNRAGALMMELESAHSRLYAATEAHKKAHAAFHDYLDSLTAK